MGYATWQGTLRARALRNLFVLPSISFFVMMDKGRSTKSIMATTVLLPSGAFGAIRNVSSAESPHRFWTIVLTPNRLGELLHHSSQPVVQFLGPSSPRWSCKKMG